MRRGATLLALGVSLVIAPTYASAATDHVDGISDQSLPFWDHSFQRSPFASFFRDSWVGGSTAHIRLARYVVQWDAFGKSLVGEHARYHAEFELWLSDVRALGLIPDVALTDYIDNHSDPPRSLAEYRRELTRLLDRADAIYPIKYIEAWNEPNNGGGYRRPSEAFIPAQFANEANATCASNGCEVIAGNLEDSGAIAAYQGEYARALNWRPHLWGVHPYVAVKSHDSSNLATFTDRLASEGFSSASQLWFTEVGAYYCVHGEVRGVQRQASDAAYLVDTLMPTFTPAHVFYYEFMFKDDEPVPCDTSSDVELYNPDDSPRPAAALIASAPVRLWSDPWSGIDWNSGS